MKKIIGFLVAAVLFTTAASAQQMAGKRLYRHSVTQGVRSGELTRGEMRNLHRDNMHYKVAKRRALRDGHVGPAERRHLKHIKRDQRRDLYRYKHNGRHRVI